MPNFTAPDFAWHNPVFRTYLAIVLAMLALAGIVLSVLTWVFHKDVRSIWATYRGWLMMVPVAATAFWLGRVPIVALFTVLSLLAFKEFARATGLCRDRWMAGTIYLAIIGAAAVILVRDPHTGAAGWYGLFMALPVVVVALVAVVPILRGRVSGQLQSMALGLFGFTCVGWMFLHLGFLTGSSNPYGYLLYLLFAVEINDIAAFCCGRLLGRSRRHVLRSAISPRKTWEGALGALLVSMALPWALRFSFPRFGPLQLLLSGLIVGIGGQLGDLSISVIKRDLGIKDMGAGIPGHGGVLDRIDSLIYTAPLFMHMIDYFYQQF